MPLTTIDCLEFEKRGSELIKLMNSCFKTDIYTLDCVDIIQSMKNYSDGNGFCLVSAAGVRNPIDGQYDMYLDLVGTPDEAIALLMQSVEKLIISGAVVIKDSHKKNNTVLN